MDGLKLRYDILCVRCGTEVTRIRPHKLKNGEIIGYEEWYRNEKGHPICIDCWKATIGDKRKLRFLGVRVFLSWNPRTGNCSKCQNNVFDGTCDNTNLHHEFYLTICPWFGTVELCPSCHGKITSRRGNKT